LCVAYVFTSHPVRCHGHERDPSGGRARPRIDQPWIHSRPKLPAANHRSTGPRSALPPGPRRAGREVASRDSARPFQPARETVGTPARRKHRGAGAPSARLALPGRLASFRPGQGTAARMRALAWLGVGARRAAAMDHSGARTIWVGWIWLDRWLPRSFLLQCAQDGDPFFFVHVLPRSAGWSWNGVKEKYC